MRRGIDRGIALGVLSGVNALLAITHPHPSGPRMFLWLMSGPIGGWVHATRAGELPSALVVLTLFTAPTLLALVATSRTDSRFALGCLVILWWLAGYFFCIGMWI